MKIILAKPRGFCAGVNRAITIVKQALELYNPPIYVLHEIVHNTHVIRELEQKGAIFVEELEEIPSGSVAIFSAHGVPPAIERQAKQLGLRTIDATCPLVSKVHRRVSRLNKIGYDILVIGHKGHPEVVGTCGHATGSFHVVSTPGEVAALEVANPAQVGYVTQTTLSLDDTREMIDAIHKRFPEINAPERTDICYATTNRQVAMRKLSAMVDLVLVVGSKNSSNSNRLREAAANCGTAAYLIDEASEINTGWLDTVQTIGVSAGASAPEHLVTDVTHWLMDHGGESVVEMDGEEETISFQLPDLTV